MSRMAPCGNKRGGLANDPPPPGLTFSKARTPTFASLEPLRACMSKELARKVLDMEPGITAFEQPENTLLLHKHEAIVELDTLESWVQAFDTLVVPAVVTPGTRAGYFAQWRSVVTYAYTMNVLEQLMPMSDRLLKAFLLQLILVGYSVGTINGYVSAIKHRHRVAKCKFSVCADDLHDWVVAIRRNRGTPSTPKFKILPAHLKMSMQLPWETVARLRDILILSVGTVCALRSSEVTQLDVCDLSWDHDGPDTLMLRVKHLKNRKKREGLFPRIGRAKCKRFDVLQMLRMYLKWARLQKKAGCSKATHPANPCEACGRLFRLTHPSGKGVQRAGISKTHVTSAVKNVLRLIGIDAAGYSGISMRKGGVSAAVIGGIPHDLRVMQTGHRSTAWEHYFDLENQEELYRFFSVFGL